MPQSLSRIYIHAVFSTKDRRPYLQDIEVQRRLHEYIGGACRELGCPSVRVGGVFGQSAGTLSGFMSNGNHEPRVRLASLGDPGL
jgi:hypothetical protein